MSNKAGMLTASRSQLADAQATASGLHQELQAGLAAVNGAAVAAADGGASSSGAAAAAVDNAPAELQRRAAALEEQKVNADGSVATVSSAASGLAVCQSRWRLPRGFWLNPVFLGSLSLALPGPTPALHPARLPADGGVPEPVQLDQGHREG